MKGMSRIFMALTVVNEGSQLRPKSREGNLKTKHVVKSRSLKIFSDIFFQHHFNGLQTICK